MAAPETALLRERQRYLGDDALARVQVLIGWSTGVLLNAVLVAGPLLLLGAILALIPGLMPTHRATWGSLPVVAFAVPVYIGGAVLWQNGGAERDVNETRPPQESRARLLRVAGALLTGLSCAILLFGLPFAWWWLGVTVLLAIGGAAVWWMARDMSKPWWWPNISRSLFSAAWISVGLSIVALPATGALGNPTSWDELRHQSPWQWGLAATSVLLILGFAYPDQTFWSPHSFYKARLASTFAVRRVGSEAQPLNFDEYTYLSDWATPAPGGPQLLVCATANLEDLSVPPAATRAVPFIFAHDHVGSPELGWWSTDALRKCLGTHLAPDGTLQAAMAISGAAVASALGVQGRIPSAGTALAIANARLGVWLPNPRSTAAWPSSGWRAWWCRRRRAIWLWREVTALFPGKKRFVYVSDGGHLDNLGLLELLRRRCRLILIIDASGDRAFTTGALDGVLSLANKHLALST